MSKIKKCALCNSEFICGGIFGCWCEGIKITPEQRIYLSSVSSDCVCPDCINKEHE